MEFDKSKILTVATADRLTQGQMGWIENSIQELAESVRTFKPSRVLKNEGDNSFECPFISNIFPKRYFYPAPEPTYAERKAQWVKENNVKGGTKVRVTRTFTKNEDGCYCRAHDDLVGMTGVVSEYSITSHNLWVDLSDGSMRAIPYFALEVVKELSYAELQSKWVEENYVSNGMTVRVTRNFGDNEAGSLCFDHQDMAGVIGKITSISLRCIQIDIGNEKLIIVPYTVLEIVKEPTYRPFKNAEEFKPYRDDWLTIDGSFFKPYGYNDVGLLVENTQLTWKYVFDIYTFENGTPCGVKT